MKASVSSKIGRSGRLRTPVRMVRRRTRRPATVTVNCDVPLPSESNDSVPKRVRETRTLPMVSVRHRPGARRDQPRCVRPDYQDPAMLMATHNVDFREDYPDTPLSACRVG